MLYTKNQIKRLIDQYEILLEYVGNYIQEKYPKGRRGDCRIEYGRIEEYVNTSCHCHPEYQWEDRGSVEEFSEWINSEGNKYKTTHYTIN